MNLRIHTVRGLFWSAIQRTGGQAISLAAFIVLSRLLQPSDFGLLALANAYLLVALLVIEQGVNQAIVQRVEVSPDHLDTAFLLSMFLACTLSLITIVVAGPLARLFREPTLEPVLWCLSPTLILAGLRATQAALLQRQLRFRELAVRTTIAESIGGGIGIAMAVGGMGVWSLVGQALGRGIAGVVVLWRVADWRPHLRLVRQPFREITRFGIPVLGDRLVNLVQGKADDLVIGLALGATTLGYYTVGYRMLTYMTQLLAGTVQSVALPVLARLQADLSRFRRTFLTMLQYLSLAAFPAFVGIAFVARDAVPIIFGPQWTASVPVMQVLALAGAAKTLPMATATAFVALGRPGLQLRLNIVTTCLAVLGFVVFVKQGVVAVALVHLGVAVLVLPLHVASLDAAVGISPGAYVRGIRTAGLGILGMSAILLALSSARTTSEPSLGWLALTLALGATTYFSVTYMLGRGEYARAQVALRDGILSSPVEQPAEVGLEPF